MRITRGRYQILSNNPDIEMYKKSSKKIDVRQFPQDEKIRSIHAKKNNDV